MVYLCGRPLATAAGARSAARPRFSRWCGRADGWLRTTAGEGIPAIGDEAPASGTAGRTTSPRIRCARTSTVPRLPLAFQWLRSPWPDEFFSPDRASRTPAALRPRDDRQPVPPGAGRAPPAVALLQRRDSSSSVRAGALSADGGARLLLQRVEVPLPVTSRTTQTVGRHLRVMSSLAGPGQADAFTRRSRSRTAGPIELRVEVDFERLRFRLSRGR